MHVCYYLLNEIGIFNFNNFFLKKKQKSKRKLLVNNFGKEMNGKKRREGKGIIYNNSNMCYLVRRFFLFCFLQLEENLNNEICMHPLEI